MKKLLGILLALCLPAAAMAETVPEQVRAPERVVDEWVSSTGMTVIPVDAPVIVPDAEAMYIIPVSTHIFEDDMVPRLAELFWPGLTEKMQVKDDKVSDGARTIAVSHWAGITHWGTAQEDIHIQVQTGYSLYAGFDEPQASGLNASLLLGNDHRVSKEINYNSAFITGGVDGEGIEGHPLTSEQAADIAAGFLRELTDEPFEVFMVGQAPGIIYDDDLIWKGLQYRDTGSSYVVSLARLIEGSSLLPTMSTGMNTTERTDLMTPPVGYEEVTVSLDLAGRITGFYWRNPYDIGTERIPQALLPFDDILAIANRVMPLAYQWGEAKAEPDQFAVTRIQLGYMAVLQRDAMSFALTPVWNFYGTETYATLSGDTSSVYMSLLTLNATDGTVIDLYLGY